MSTTPSADYTLTTLYHRLAKALGPSGWWPADSAYEILVGAILVQNTNWQNVDRSLANLREATAFTPQTLAALEPAALQTLIRPSGFYRNKAKALHALFTWLLAHGDLAGVRRQTPDTLRKALLALPGIGPETADAMRLYVFDQPPFIADNYSRRLFGWLGQSFTTYPQLAAQTHAVDHWPLADAQEFHGLIDNFGKTVKTAADFDRCFLAGARLTLA